MSRADASRVLGTDNTRGTPLAMSAIYREEEAQQSYGDIRLYVERRSKNVL